jgi:hypothetical protein
LALAAIAMHLITSRTLPSWRSNHFNAVIAAITILLLFAFIRGLPEIGITQWAFANRVTGWFVLLGYLGAGYLIVVYLGRHGLRRFVQTMTITAATIVIVRSVMRWLDHIELIDLINLPHHFQAYAGNRNAFAFQLLACSILLLAYSTIYLRADTKSRHVINNINQSDPGLLLYYKRNSYILTTSILHGIILAGIALTESRAGLITGMLLLITAAFFNIANRKMIGISLMFAILIWFVVQVGFGFSGLQNTFARDYSDVERWETITRGLDIWLESPLIGAGLGVFIERSVEWSKSPINIHSTPVWILAEFGILGLGLFTGILAVIIRFVYRSGLILPANRIIIMLIGIFLIFSLVHEIFYQRIFWLVLGAAMALPGAMYLEHNRAQSTGNG